MALGDSPECIDNVKGQSFAQLECSVAVFTLGKQRMTMFNSDLHVGIWVIDETVSVGCLERLGDARRLANQMQTQVGVLLAGADENTRQDLIQHGADLVCSLERITGLHTKVITTAQALRRFQPRVVFAGADAPAREWAALLAAHQDWLLVSPALFVEYLNGVLQVTRLDHSGRKSCPVDLADQETVVVTMRVGVAEVCAADESRSGEMRTIELSDCSPSMAEPKSKSRLIPADPATVDIRHADCLLAGGRGLGGKTGFDLLRRVASKLDASVAASRMAVDLGWIEYERQVGQTGKTVVPDLYIACGISGASHHLDGMSQSKGIVAINTDPHAPIFKVAHLGLVADLHEVLQSVERRLT